MIVAIANNLPVGLVVGSAARDDHTFEEVTPASLIGVGRSQSFRYRLAGDDPVAHGAAPQRPPSERSSIDAACARPACGDYRALAEYLRPRSGATSGRPMDDRVEAFLSDVLALDGDEPEAIRAGVKVALGEVETIFRAREDNRGIKDKAAQACHALCRGRVVEEIRLRKATKSAKHLKLVLTIIDNPRHFSSR
jgi:hypothetical protein